MGRAVLVVCLLGHAAAAQPVGAPTAPSPQPTTTLAVAEPAPVPTTTPPAAYPLPPSATEPQPYPAPAPPRERSDRFAFGLGVLVGAADDWIYGAYTAEAALTILRAPLRTRARVFGSLIGGTIESDWSGAFHRYGAGLEGRWCTAASRTCLFVDLDAGYERLTMRDGDGDFVRSDTGLVAGPRFGVDGGGAFRVRVALEILEHVGNHVGSSGERFEAFTTVGVALALGFQL